MSYENPADEFRDAISAMGGITPVVPPPPGCPCDPRNTLPDEIEMAIMPPNNPGEVAVSTVVLPAPMFMADHPDARLCVVIGMPPGYPHAVRVAGIKVREFPNGERGLMILISTARPTWFQRAADWLWRRFAGV